MGGGVDGAGELVSGLDEALDAAEAPDADLRAGVLIVLLDALAAAPALTLVLDNVHLVAEEPGTLAALDWVLARLPVSHEVLLAARRDTALPALTRARMRGEVLDVRTDDLRFAAGEAQRSLGDRLGLTLDAGEIAALDAAHRRAGRRRCTWRRCGCGWATTSQPLMEQLGDEDLFGADRRAAALGARARAALHRRDLGCWTASTHRCAHGCWATTRARSDRSRAARCCTARSTAPAPGSAATTSCATRCGPGSPTRRPARSRELHRRAGAWFESEGGEGELHEAMRHYLAAAEWDLAAELLARHALAFVQSGALGGRAREWLAGFPAPVVREDARLGYVSALLAAFDGDRAGRDGWLEAAHAAAGPARCPTAPRPWSSRAPA